MPTMGYLQTWIEVENKPLEEFSIKTIANETCQSCHVPSEVGKNYVICIKQSETPSDGHKRMVEIHVDGKRTNKTVLHTNTITRISGYRTQKNLRRPFVFASIPKRPLESRTIKRSTKLQINSLAGLGTVRLIIATVRLKPKPENPDRTFRPRAGSTGYLTDEISLLDLLLNNSKDVAMHYTKLDEGVIVSHEGGRISDVATEYPVSQFTFRYAPMGTLMSEGITRYSKEAPFSGLLISDWDIDRGSELLEESDRAQYRQLKLEIAARHRLRQLKER